MQTTIPDLVDRNKAAELLGIKPQTLAAWKACGRYDLPCVKIGRLVRYKLSDIAAFIERHTGAPAAVEL